METSKFGEKIMKKNRNQTKAYWTIIYCYKGCTINAPVNSVSENCTLKIRYLLGFTYIASDHFRVFFYVSHISNEILSFENKYLVEKGNS